MSQPRSDRPGPERSSPSTDAPWVRAAVAQFEVPLTLYAARLMAGDVDRARDIVQDTFLRLWTADRAELDGHLGQWLYRVCRNRALDVRRKESRMTTLDDHVVEARDQKERRETEREAASGMIDVLHTLPERQQEILRLKFQGGLSYKEIANVMDITVNHVGVMIHTAIQSIREKMTVSPGGINLKFPDAPRTGLNPAPNEVMR